MNDIINIIEEFIHECKFIKGLSIKTCEAYKSDLMGFEIYCETVKIKTIKKITQKIIREYFGKLYKDKIKTTSFQRKISSINLFLEYANQNQYITTNPMLEIHRPKSEQKLPKTIDEKTVNTLIENLTHNNKDIRLKVIIMLMYYAGMRVSEVCNLPLSAIQYKDPVTKMHILPYINITGKGNKERFLPLHINLQNAIMDYIPFRKDFLNENIKNTYLFPAKSKSINRVTIYLAIKQLAIKANIDPQTIHPHAFRHCIALHLLKKGMDIRYLQEFLGHSDISTTSLYTKLNTSDIENLINNHHPALKNQ